MSSLLRAALLPLCAVAGALAPLAWATARPDPADPTVPVPPAIYQSPLRSYQNLRDNPVASWRQTNDRLWRRGAAADAEPADAAAQPAVSASSPMPAGNGHAGHHMK